MPAWLRDELGRAGVLLVLVFPLAALLVLWVAPIAWSQPESTGEFFLTAGYATAVLGGMAWLVSFDPTELRRRRRIEANRCPSCGYSRDGLGSRVCPECGAIGSG